MAFDVAKYKSSKGSGFNPAAYMASKRETPSEQDVIDSLNHDVLTFRGEPTEEQRRAIPETTARPLPGMLPSGAVPGAIERAELDEMLMREDPSLGQSIGQMGRAIGLGITGGYGDIGKIPGYTDPGEPQDPMIAEAGQMIGMAAPLGAIGKATTAIKPVRTALGAIERVSPVAGTAARGATDFGLYEGLRKPGEGESRLLNALGGTVVGGVFGLGAGMVGKGLSGFGRRGQPPGAIRPEEPIVEPPMTKMEPPGAIIPEKPTPPMAEPEIAKPSPVAEAAKGKEPYLETTQGKISGYGNFDTKEEAISYAQHILERNPIGENYVPYFSGAKPTPKSLELSQEIWREAWERTPSVMIVDQPGKGLKSKIIYEGPPLNYAKTPPVTPKESGIYGMPAGARMPQPTETPVIEPVKRSDIVKNLQEKLGVPIRTGRAKFNIFGRSYLGFFKTQPNVIRIQTAKDMPTISHEIGHALDQSLNIIGSENLRSIPKELRAGQQELYKMGRELYKSFTGKRARGEGFAEFLRLYLTDSEQLKLKAPNFLRQFVSLMQENQEIHQVLRTARKDIWRWNNQPAAAKVLSEISIGQKSPAVGIKETAQKVYSAAKDAFYPTRVAVKEMTGGKIPSPKDDPYILQRLFRGVAGKAETMLEYGFLDEQGNKIGSSLVETLKPVMDNLDDFRIYAISKRSLELSKRGIQTGIDVSTATKAVNEVTRPEFEQVLKNLVQYQDNLLRQLIDSGILTKDAAATMRTMNEHYIPFFRVFDESGAGSGLFARGFGNLKNPIKRIKGSSRDILDPFESIIKNTYFLTQIAERNKVGRALIRLADKTPGSGLYVEEVKTPMQGIKFKLEDITQDLLDLGVEIPQEIPLAQTSLSVFRPSVFAPGKENILTIFVDGKPKFYQLHPELYRTMLELDTESSNMLINLLSKPASMLRAGATLTPEFAIRNPIRDQFSAFVYGKYGITTPVDFMQGLFSAIKKDNLYYQWKNSGGAHATLVSIDRDYLQGSLRKMMRRGFKDKTTGIIFHPIQTLRAISEFTEEATRLGQFRKVFKKTGDPTLAAFESKEITLDFSRIGSKMKAPNRIIAFLNAGIEGIDKSVRAFKDKPFATTVKATSAITVPSILLYLANRNNPDYKERPRWERDVFWLIPAGQKPNGHTRFFRIPKPFELGIVFGTIPERVLEWIETQDKNALDGLTKSVWSAMSPGVIPTAFLPLIEVWANKSSYFDRPIVSQGQEHLEPFMQFREFTPETIKTIGKIVNVSPSKIEHLIQGYTGGLGRYALSATDFVGGAIGVLPQKEGVRSGELIERIPGIKGLVSREPGSNAESIKKFYDYYEKTQTASTTLRKLGGQEFLKYAEEHAKELTDAAAMRKIADDISTIRDWQKTIRLNPEISEEEKKFNLSLLSDLMITIAQSAFLNRKQDENIKVVGAK